MTLALTSEQSLHDGVDPSWPGGGALPDPERHIVIDDRATMLSIGAHGGRERIAELGERAGLRSLGTSSLVDAPSRIGQCGRLDLLMIDLRDLDVNIALDRSIPRALFRRQASGSPDVAVIATMDQLDCAIAMFDMPGAEFLCEPADSDIVSLLVMAGLAKTSDPVVFDDQSLESQTARLDRLSADVRRLAEGIERITGREGAAGAGEQMADSAIVHADMVRRPSSSLRRRQEGAPEQEGIAPTHAEMRAIIRARRMRDQFLPADLFADPAWDMMLDLLAARLADQRVSVSSLCIASAVPPTTALRWIRQLTERGVFARIDDPADGRRVFIELTESAAQAVLAWTKAVRRGGGLLCGALPGVRPGGR